MMDKPINRRFRIRREANGIEVYLRSSVVTSNRLVKMSVKDISNKGAFIKCNPKMFAKGMSLYLIFALRMGSVVKLHRVSAAVARVTADGIGVSFLIKTKV